MVIYDLKTKNKSFLKTYEKLEKLGVRQCNKILKVINPKVVGLDPFSEDLTSEQRCDIVTEAAKNPWYFTRECVKVLDENRKPVHFNLIPKRFLLMDALFTGRKTYTSAVRLSGKTTAFLVAAKHNSLVGIGTTYLHSTVTNAKLFENKLKHNIIVPDYFHEVSLVDYVSTYNGDFHGTIEQDTCVLVDDFEFHRNTHKILESLKGYNRVNIASTWNANLSAPHEKVVNEFFSNNKYYEFNNSGLPYNKKQFYNIEISKYEALSRPKVQKIAKALMSNINHPELTVRKPHE